MQPTVDTFILGITLFVFTAIVLVICFILYLYIILSQQPINTSREVRHRLKRQPIMENYEEPYFESDDVLILQRLQDSRDDMYLPVPQAKTVVHRRKQRTITDELRCNQLPAGNVEPMLQIPEFVVRPLREEDAKWVIIQAEMLFTINQA